jgi:hypothetical protein
VHKLKKRRRKFYKQENKSALYDAFSLPVLKVQNKSMVIYKHGGRSRQLVKLRYYCKHCLKPLSRRERVRKDSKRVEAKRKCWGGEVRNTLFGGGGEERASYS